MMRPSFSKHGVGRAICTKLADKPVAIRHGGLLNRTPALYGAQTPTDSTRKPICGFCPKPTAEKVSHISRAGICKTIFGGAHVAGFLITPSTVNAP